MKRSFKTILLRHPLIRLPLEKTKPISISFLDTQSSPQAYSLSSKIHDKDMGIRAKAAPGNKTITSLLYRWYFIMERIGGISENRLTDIIYLGDKEELRIYLPNFLTAFMTFHPIVRLKSKAIFCLESALNYLSIYLIITYHK